MKHNTAHLPVEQSTDKCRILLLDIAKGISIILMTITHFPHLDKYPIAQDINGNIFMAFKMPMFFLVSGYLLSLKYDFKTFIYKKSDALIKTTLFALFFLCILYSFETKDSSIFLKYVQHLFNGKIIPEGIGGGPLWFPISLFIALLVSRVALKSVEKVNQKLYQILILIGLTSILISFYLLQIRVLFLDTLVFSVPFILIGAKFKKIVPLEKLEHFFSNKFILAGVLIVEVLLIIYSRKWHIYLNIGDPNGPVIGSNILGVFVKSILSIFLTFFTCIQLQRIFLIRNFLILCSKASFIILAFHKIAASLLLRFIDKFKCTHVFFDIVLFIGTILLCIGIFFLIQKISLLNIILLPYERKNIKQKKLNHSSVSTSNSSQ